MQFSENWLRSYVNTSLDSDALNHVMIMAGLDVDESHPLGAFYDPLRQDPSKSIALGVESPKVKMPRANLQVEEQIPREDHVERHRRVISPLGGGANMTIQFHILAHEN